MCAYVYILKIKHGWCTITAQTKPIAYFRAIFTIIRCWKITLNEEETAKREIITRHFVSDQRHEIGSNHSNIFWKIVFFLADSNLLSNGILIFDIIEKCDMNAEFEFFFLQNFVAISIFAPDHIARYGCERMHWKAHGGCLFIYKYKSYVLYSGACVQCVSSRWCIAAPNVNDLFVIESMRAPCIGKSKMVSDSQTGVCLDLSAVPSNDVGQLFSIDIFYFHFWLYFVENHLNMVIVMHRK